MPYTILFQFQNRELPRVPKPARERRLPGDRVQSEIHRVRAAVTKLRKVGVRQAEIVG